MTSKRWQEQGQGTGKRLQTRQKHLYLVLDDWAKGFTIRKIDADNDPHLGVPPVVRLVAPERRDAMSFAALGSNILAAGNRHPGTLVYDTETAGLATGPCLPGPLLGGVNIFVVVGGALPASDWPWRSVPFPPPLRPEEVIVSYAVHPDERTIFLSAARGALSRRTFPFDTGRREWRRHGNWALPFTGQGYFDSQLGTWVGLHKDGGVCSCRVASRSSASAAPPEWEVVGDKLWSHDKVAFWPTLTYMGGARFCVVECVVREGLEYEDAFGDRDGCVLHITTFGLKYGRKGELRTIGCTTKSHVVSKHSSPFSPVAFWM
ncbi:hypothetical protein PVAP13_1KG044800 [Panicum virgatum]|uniref:Uncharacterized protein n=1 Tax=Panicum virgatum TaxID=38727 RepID=A0A8T0XAA8_PANVG|nr:hypothetical protein PVAP13_1KG044800 [Panicum virgatum]